jgi:hypothetical protein
MNIVDRFIQVYGPESIILSTRNPEASQPNRELIGFACAAAEETLRLKLRHYTVFDILSLARDMLDTTLQNADKNPLLEKPNARLPVFITD